MPLLAPTVDRRTYQDLFDEAVARIPVHTPEWTNFNKSDPGITIIGVLAFLTESLLYRANQIPDRNRLKFLQLLGVPLSEASAARGLVSFSNDNGPPVVFPLTPDMELDSGQLPFRTTSGMDLLPIQTRVYFKRTYQAPDQTVSEYYRQLYSSFTVPPAQPSPQSISLSLYQLSVLGPGGASSVDLSADTVDGSVWVALFARSTDVDAIDAIKKQIAGKTLSLGMVPGIAAGTVELKPNPIGAADLGSVLGFYMPALGPSMTQPSYRRVDAAPRGDVLTEPGVIEIVLPSADQLDYWSDLDPLEAGTAQYPPTIDDTALAARLITWIRVSALSPTDVDIVWMGGNTALVTQRTHVSGEVLPPGTGAPGQRAVLAHRPVLAGSVKVTVAPPARAAQTWIAIDDLMAAGPEVPVVDPRNPPGTTVPVDRPTQVFLLDPEAGTLTFGDGTYGARPPAGATISVEYDYSAGAAGNVEAAAISAGPTLPSGVSVSNPIRTWGGADAETVDRGVTQITRYLQHRDRLVTKSDFEALAWRTPGVSMGRVDVLSAFDPRLSPNAPGDAPGVVTLMAIPSYDPENPDAPVPSQTFLNAIGTWLEPRRLVTTELVLLGPQYRDVWLSIGISVVPGSSVYDVVAAVKAAIAQFLSPLPAPGVAPLPDVVSVYDTSAPSLLQVDRGWPLGKAVVSLEALAVASRVSGVQLVNDVLLGTATGAALSQIAMTGLQLPRLAGLSVTTGDPLDLDSLRGKVSKPSGATPPSLVVPVPVIPENC